MDTHITATPELDRTGTSLGSPIGLPGELQASDGSAKQADILDEVPAPDTSQAASTKQSALHKKSRRKTLLATAALGTVLLAGAGGAAWWYRQDLRQALDLRHVGLPAFLHGVTGPGNQLSAEVGAQPDSAPVSQVRRVDAPPAPAVLRPQVSEFAALQSLPNNAPAEVGVSAPAVSPAASSRDTAPGPSPTNEAPSTRSAAPAAQPALPAGPLAGTAATDAARIPNPFVETPAAPLPAPPVAAPSMTQQPITASVSGPAQTTATPPTTAPAASPAPTPAVTSAPASRDPVAVVAELHAAPLSPPEQVKVVDLLKELGAQLRDTRAEVVQLRTTVAQLVETVDTKTTQFESRLGLAEAGTVLAQSARAGHPETAAVNTPSLPASRVAATGRVAFPIQQGGTALSASASRTVRDYRIQGASPGLAVLSVLNPVPGGKSVIEVSTGSEVPGVGRIKSIAQRGTAWVVQTDAGVIQ